MSEYTILEKLGEGGMGQVYRAIQTRLKRPVAIKTIVPDYATDPQILQRFRREVKLLCGLSHPHIVPVFDSGMIGQKPFFVMELVVGTPLDERIRDGGPPGIVTTARLVSQLADAVAYLHGKGIQHRDIKTKNLILANRDGEEHLVLVDFGLARAGFSRGLTKAGELVGTIAYLPPEALESDDTGSPRDVWAIGAVAVELLTGQPLFTGSTCADLAQAILAFDPQSLRTRLAGCPPWLVERIMGCLETDPAKRISASDLHHALEEHLDTSCATPASLAEGAALEAAPGGVRGMVSSGVGYRTGPRMRPPARIQAAGPVAVAILVLALAIGRDWKDEVSTMPVTSVTPAPPRVGSIERMRLWRTLTCVITDRAVLVDFEMPEGQDVVVNVRELGSGGVGRELHGAGTDRFFHQTFSGLEPESLHELTVRTASGEVLLDRYALRTFDASFRTTEREFLRGIDDSGWADMALDFLASRPDPELAPRLFEVLRRTPVEHINAKLYARLAVSMCDRTMLRAVLGRLPPQADGFTRMCLVSAQADLGIIDHVDEMRRRVIALEDHYADLGAARVLARHRSPDSLALLESMADRGTWVPLIAPAMIECAPEGARRAFTRWLDPPGNPPRDLRLLGAMGLAELGEPRDVETIARVMRDAADEEHDRLLAPWLADAGGPAARDTLVSRRASTSVASVVWGAARAGAAPPAAEGGPGAGARDIAMRAVRALVADPSPALRRDALDWLSGEPGWGRDLGTWLSGLWRTADAVPILEVRAAKPEDDPTGLAVWSLAMMGAGAAPAGLAERFLTEVTGDDPEHVLRHCVLLAAAHRIDPEKSRSKLEDLVNRSVLPLPLRDLSRLLLGRRGHAAGETRRIPLIPLVSYQPIGLSVREGQTLHVRGWGIHAATDRPEGWVYFAHDPDPHEVNVPYSLMLRRGGQGWNLDWTWRSFIAERAGEVLFTPFKRQPPKYEVDFDRLIPGLVILEILEPGV